MGKGDENAFRKNLILFSLPIAINIAVKCPKTMKNQLRLGDLNCFSGAPHESYDEKDVWFILVPFGLTIHPHTAQS